MRRFRCAAVAAAAIFGFALVASAADLPTKAPVYKAPVAIAPSWTGFYIGVNGGYGWKDRTVNFTPNDIAAQLGTCSGGLGGTCASPTSFGIGGGFGGLQAGYNWQFNPNWLLGVETDFDWSHIKGTGTSNFILFSVVPAASTFEASQNVKWFGTVRGRLGYLPANNILVYATGGFAYGHIDQTVALNSQPGANLGSGVFAYGCVAGPNCFLGSSSRTTTGWTVGGGAEYAVWSNVSVKAEYLYVNLGGSHALNVVTQSVGGFLGATPSSFTATFSRTDFHTVRAGLNWKF